MVPGIHQRQGGQGLLRGGGQTLRSRRVCRSPGILQGRLPGQDRSRLPVQHRPMPAQAGTDGGGRHLLPDLPAPGSRSPQPGRGRATPQGHREPAGCRLTCHSTGNVSSPGNSPDRISPRVPPQRSRNTPCTGDGGYGRRRGPWSPVPPLPSSSLPGENPTSIPSSGLGYQRALP